jgi:hypothetical protein
MPSGSQRKKMATDPTDFQAPGGSPVDIGGGTFDVLRRRDNGAWRQTLDLPFCHAADSV